MPQDPYGAVDPLRTVQHHVTSAARAHGLRLTDAEVASVSPPSASRPRRRAADRTRTPGAAACCSARCIAAATVHDPPLVLADEPTSALDHDSAEVVLGVLAPPGSALLLVTHDLDVAASAADTVLVMYGGRIIERGSVSRVLESPRHPYTAALVAAIPRPGRAPAPLEGHPPDPRSADRVCAFAPRCPRALAVCFSTATPAGDVSCHVPG